MPLPKLQITPTAIFSITNSDMPRVFISSPDGDVEVSSESYWYVEYFETTITGRDRWLIDSVAMNLDDAVKYLVAHRERLHGPSYRKERSVRLRQARTGEVIPEEAIQ